MKILFLNDFIPPRHVGGPGKRNFEIALELKKMGHDIFFITSCQKKEMEITEEKNGIKIFNIYSNYSSRFREYFSIYNPKTAKKARKIMEELKPDIIHADTIHYHLSYACLKSAKTNAKAVFLTSRDFMLFNPGKFLQKERFCGKINYKINWFARLKSSQKRFNPLRNILIKKYLKNVDRILAVSGELKEAFRQNGILNVEVLHNGLPLPQKDPQWNMLLSDNILLYGRINEAKGVYALIDALPTIKSSVPSARLILAGASEEEFSKINNYLAKTGLAGSVEARKWISGPEMENLIESAALIASPSLYPDPFPGVNLEAAAHLKPVVTTCFGGAKEFVINGQTGYVVNPFDIKELAEKIIDLLKNKEKAKNFAIGSFKRLKENFSVESRAAILENFYKKFIS